MSQRINRMFRKIAPVLGAGMLLQAGGCNLDINTIRWLEDVLRESTSTMVIISHDRHFLNSVCTHMADLDYGQLRLFPGNYDEYMTAATQATGVAP